MIILLMLSSAFNLALLITIVFILDSRENKCAIIYLKEDGIMKLDNKVYDVLKYIAQIVLPAIATFYFALSTIWGLPYGEEIVGTISAIDVLLGALLGISTMQYNKGLKQ